MGSDVEYPIVLRGDRLSASSIECCKCHGFGHFAKDCTSTRYYVRFGFPLQETFPSKLVNDGPSRPDSSSFPIQEDASLSQYSSSIATGMQSGTISSTTSCGHPNTASLICTRVMKPTSKLKSSVGCGKLIENGNVRQGLSGNSDYG